MFLAIYRCTYTSYDNHNNKSLYLTDIDFFRATFLVHQFYHYTHLILLRLPTDLIIWIIFVISYQTSRECHNKLFTMILLCKVSILSFICFQIIFLFSTCHKFIMGKIKNIIKIMSIHCFLDIIYTYDVLIDCKGT